MRTPSFACGPLRVRVSADDATLREKITEALRLYDLTWDEPHRTVALTAHRSPIRARMLAGSFLTCARMTVDATLAGLRASTRIGMSASGRFRDGGERWSVVVPERALDAGRLEELEDLMSLVLTTGWRRAGWIPIHAAAVLRGERCALLCSPSGGGKSTLTAALVRRGWHALGDDKVLLRCADGEPPVLAALLHTFNLHPRTRWWVPDVGELERLPRYSAWTDKRKVRAGDIWPDRLATRAEPTDLVQLTRDVSRRGVRVAPLPDVEVLSTLLRQTVVPTDREAAHGIVATVAATARCLRGWRVQVGEAAYQDIGTVDGIAEMLR